jgi:putative MATE family efflux protein
MRIFMLSLPMGFGLFLVRNALQGIGDSTTPLYFLTGSVMLNAVLDPLLMFGWLGMPRLGLNGTAWAALIAQGLALAALVAVLRSRKNLVAPALSLRGFDWHTAWLTIKIGMPSALQHAFISLGMLTVMGIVNSFGKNAAAAYGVASQIDMLAFMPAMSFGMAASTLAGQNIGANRYHRVREILLSGCLLGGTVTAVASIIVVSMPRLILSIFTHDAVLLDIGTGYLRTVGACYVFFGIMFMSNGIINGSGHTMVATVISLVSQWAVRVPLAYVLSKWMGRVEGVWYALAISFGISLVGSMGYYLTGLWRRPVIKHRPIPSTDAALLGEEGGEA